MPYMVTFTINIPQMLAYIPYMDPMGYKNSKSQTCFYVYVRLEVNSVEKMTTPPPSPGQ